MTLAGSRARLWISAPHAVLRHRSAVRGQPAVREILPHVTCPVTSYGFSEDAQVRAVNVRAQAGQMHFTVQRRNGVTLPDLDIVLNLAGEHNVLNALSAIAIAVELNIPDEAVQRALAGFKGVGRRFQSYGNLPAKDGGQFTVIDDYGHHPVEMAATLAAARAVPSWAPTGAGLPAPPLQPHTRLL